MEMTWRLQNVRRGRRKTAAWHGRRHGVSTWLAACTDTCKLVWRRRQKGRQLLLPLLSPSALPSLPFFSLASYTSLSMVSCSEEEGGGRRMGDFFIFSCSSCCSSLLLSSPPPSPIYHQYLYLRRGGRKGGKDKEQDKTWVMELGRRKGQGEGHLSVRSLVLSHLLTLLTLCDMPCMAL